MQIISKRLGAILVLLAFFAACGAPEREGTTELGEAQQGLIKSNSYGVTNVAQQCHPGYTGTCWYPPARVTSACFSASGMSATEQTRVSNALATARGVVELKADSDPLWESFELQNLGSSCNGVQNLRIVKGAVGSSGSQGLGGYLSMVCDAQSANLPESPAIAGTHRFCYRWTATVDLVDIAATWPGNEAEVTRHVTAAAVGAANLGVGLRSDGDQSVWNYTNIGPLGKWDWNYDNLCHTVWSAPEDSTAPTFDPVEQWYLCQ